MNINPDEFLWAQKYRPSDINSCITTESIKQMASDFVSKGDVPNLLLYGPPGTGKTTLAKVILNELDADFLFINGSKERNIDTLRTKIAEYASSISFGGNRKFVIIDEADGMTPQTQDALKSFIEEMSSNCGFILTSNHVNKITDALRSRCIEIAFIFSQEEKNAVIKNALHRMLSILKNENIPVDAETAQTVAALIKMHFPDFRSVLNSLQRYSSSGKIDTGILVKITTVGLEGLIESLKSKNYKKMTEWVHLNSDVSFASLLLLLYKEMQTILKPETLPSCILIMNRYDYQSAFCANSDLNTIAMLTEIMTECQFK